MRRAYPIILIVQFLLMAMFLIYALVQRTQAIKSEELAIQLKQQASEAQKHAEENEQMIVVAQHEAVKQAELARKSLDECQRKK